MKAKVIAPTTVHNLPTKVGDIVEVDELTFRNLAKKGRLEAADKASQAVDLDEPSVLSEAGAKERIETAIEAKELAASKKK